MPRLPSRAVGIWLTTAIWLAVACGIWAVNDYQLKHGTEISLKSVPVDPRDVLRGDYVILRYEISTVTGEAATVPFARNSRVFVSLATDDGEWAVRSVKLEPPKEGLFLKGRIRSGESGRLEIVYGIESFFLPEGEGKKYEEARNRDRLWAVVSVSPHGVAHLKRLEIRQ